MIENYFQATNSITLNSNGVNLDGTPTSTTALTMSPGQWTEVCANTTTYVSRGCNSRTCSSSGSAPTATAPIYVTSDNITAQDEWGNNITSLPNGLNPADVTMTFSSSTSNITTTVETPSVATYYQASFYLDQTTASASCSTEPVASLQVNYTDNWTGTAISGYNNIGLRQVNATSWTSAAVAQETAATSLTSSTIYVGMNNFPIYAQASTAVSYTLNVVTQAVCTGTYPVFKLHARFTK